MKDEIQNTHVLAIKEAPAFVNKDLLTHGWK